VVAGGRYRSLAEAGESAGEFVAADGLVPVGTVAEIFAKVASRVDTVRIFFAISPASFTKFKRATRSAVSDAV
jgi:hypothetical protein